MFHSQLEVAAMYTERATVSTYQPQRPLSIVAVAGHLFGILALVLMLAWLLHYRGGLSLYSTSASRVFNVHPFLMYFGFIFLAGEAIMAFETMGGQREARKFVHMAIQTLAICLGVVGIHAAFKFHDMINLTDMYSVHSWLGMGTFCLFILQYLAGLVMFAFKLAARETRERAKTWHVNFGRALLYMAICTAVSGLMEKADFLQLQHQHEGRLINVLGISILLFGIFVDLGVVLGHCAIY